MAKYNNDTLTFMNNLVGGSKKDSPGEKVENVTRNTLVNAKSMVTSGIASTLARNIVKPLADRAFEKQAGVHVINLFDLLNKDFGRDWWDWEPETIWDSIKDSYGQDPEDEIRNKVMALQVLVNTNAAHEHWHVFENTCRAFAGEDVDFVVLQPCEPSHVALGFSLIDQIRPKGVYEPEIYGYAASCARMAGLVYLPEDLFPKQCQKYLDELHNPPNLKKAVEEKYPEKSDDNEAVAIQLARLAEIKETVEAMS